MFGFFKSDQDKINSAERKLKKNRDVAQEILALNKNEIGLVTDHEYDIAECILSGMNRGEVYAFLSCPKSEYSSALMKVYSFRKRVRKAGFSTMLEYGEEKVRKMYGFIQDNKVKIGLHTERECQIAAQVMYGTPDNLIIESFECSMAEYGEVVDKLSKYIDNQERN